MNPNTQTSNNNIQVQAASLSFGYQESFPPAYAHLAKGTEFPPNSLQQQQPATCFHRSSRIWVTFFSKFIIHHPSAIITIFLIHSSTTFFLSTLQYSNRNYQHIYIYLHWSVERLHTASDRMPKMLTSLITSDTVARGQQKSAGQTEPGERLYTASDRMPKMLTSLITSDTVTRGSTEVSRPHFLWLLSFELQFFSFLDTHQCVSALDPWFT